MALKTCEDCRKEISTVATTCPYCGRPNMNDGIVTIQKSQKKYKRWDVIAFILLIPGFICFLFYLAIYHNVSSFNPIFSWLSLVFIAMIISGIVIAIAAGIGRWWHHG